MGLRLGHVVFACAFAAAAPRLVAQSQGTPEQMQDALHTLARLNNPSPLQPASCHGSVGTDLGAGMASFMIPPGNPVLASQLGPAGSPEKDNGNYAMPRLWLTKGLPIPLDLSLSAAVPGTGGGPSQISGYLQWTLYQALARPALAVRTSYGRLFAGPGTTLSTAGAEVVASYGVLRYFTLYARGGASQNRGSLTLRPEQSTGLGLTDPTLTSTNATWIQAERALGLRMTLWSPFIAITGEADFSYGTKPDYAAKLSYLL